MVSLTLFSIIILAFVALVGGGSLVALFLTRRRGLVVGLLACGAVLLAPILVGLVFWARSASNGTAQIHHSFYVGEGEWMQAQPQSLVTQMPAPPQPIVVTATETPHVTAEDLFVAEQAARDTASSLVPTAAPAADTVTASDSAQEAVTAVHVEAEHAPPSVDAARQVGEESAPESGESNASESTTTDSAPEVLLDQANVADSVSPAVAFGAEEAQPLATPPPVPAEHTPDTAPPAAPEPALAAPTAPTTLDGGELSNQDDLAALQTGPPTSTTTTTTADPAVPTWVKAPPQTWNGQLATTLVSDPFDNRFDCDRDLDRKTYAALAQYLRDYGVLDGPQPVNGVGLTPQELAAAVKERHYLFRETSVGVMQQAYQLTVFDETLRARLQDRYRDAVAAERVRGLGAIAVAALAVVGGLYGLCSLLTRKTPDPFETPSQTPGTAAAG